MSYGVDLTDDNLQGPLVSLQILYNQMPETSGCEKCAEINGKDEEHWCCASQSPSMYYSEFVKAYKPVEDWSKEKRKDLIFRALRNYLDNSLDKGCIFYNKGCQIYNQRPLACRLYGVISEEHWQKRWDLLKKRQGDEFQARPQCSLVTADREITPALEDKWFLHTKKCEDRIGVPVDSINLHDEAGGSYRTFHDHLLLQLFGEDMLSNLTKFRLSNPSKEDIDSTLEVLRGLIDE